MFLIQWADGKSLFHACPGFLGTDVSGFSFAFVAVAFSQLLELIPFYYSSWKGTLHRCLPVVFIKISVIQFYQWRLRSQMLGWKPASSKRQIKRSLTFFLCWHPPNPLLYTISNKTPPIQCLAFLCISLPILLTPSEYFFSIILCSFSVNWLFALPLDLRMTLFNPLCNIQAESS